MKEMTRHLDLNTLDSLSRTCRQVHIGLSLNRNALMTRTLRCQHDAFTRSRREDEEDWGHDYGIPGIYDNDWDYSYEELQPTSRCARDLVGSCRRCGSVVCRVCLHQCAVRSHPDTVEPT